MSKDKDDKDSNVVQFVPLEEYNAKKPPEPPTVEERTEETVYETDAYDPDQDSFSEHFQEMSTPVSRLALPRELNRQQVVNSFHDAFHLIGGVPRFAYWADKHPTEFYKLYSRMLPSQAQKELGDDKERIIIHAVPRSKLDE